MIKEKMDMDKDRCITVMDKCKKLKGYNKLKDDLYLLIDEVEAHCGGKGSNAYVQRLRDLVLQFPTLCK